MSSNNKLKVEENIIQDITTGQERAFYGSTNVHFKRITIKNVKTLSLKIQLLF